MPFAWTRMSHLLLGFRHFTQPANGPNLCRDAIHAHKLCFTHYPGNTMSCHCITLYTCLISSQYVGMCYTWPMTQVCVCIRHLFWVAMAFLSGTIAVSGTDHAMMTNNAHTQLPTEGFWWIAPSQPHLPRRSCQDIPADRPGHFCHWRSERVFGT